MASILNGVHGPYGSLSKLTQGIRANTDLSKEGSDLSRGPNLSGKLPAAAWSNTWPAPQATLDLDFANDRGYVRGVGNGKSMDAVTFTRASNARYIDSSGLSQNADNNTPRFDWASTTQLPQNLLTYTDNFAASFWVKGGVTLTTGVSDPFGGSLATTLTATNATLSGLNSTAVTVIASTTYTVSFWVRRRTGTGDIRFYYPNDATYSVLSITPSWQRVSLTGLSKSNGTALFDLVITTQNDAIDIYGPQLEIGTSASTYEAQGAYLAANTPLQANPTCNGLLIEESRTNRALYCRDATQASWVKTSITAAKDQTGIDGIANSATSITASSANGVLIQPVSLASGSRTSSVYLKRLTGTGTIQVTMDGTTYSTVDLSNGLWNRIVLSGTVTNPVVGIKIVTSGDAVAMDFAQIEDGAFATSPILTTSATVTRSADVASIGKIYLDSFINLNAGTLFATISISRPNINSYIATLFYDNSNYIALLFGNAGTARRFNIALNGVNNNLDTVGVSTSPTIYKFAGSYKKGFAVLSSNGVTSSIGTSINNLPTPIRLDIGGEFSSILNGCISRLVYFPKEIAAEASNLITSQAT